MRKFTLKVIELHFSFKKLLCLKKTISGLKVGYLSRRRLHGKLIFDDMFSVRKTGDFHS